MRIAHIVHYVLQVRWYIIIIIIIIVIIIIIIIF